MQVARRAGGKPGANVRHAKVPFPIPPRAAPEERGAAAVVCGCPPVAAGQHQVEQHQGRACTCRWNASTAPSPELHHAASKPSPPGTNCNISLSATSSSTTRMRCVRWMFSDTVTSLRRSPEPRSPHRRGEATRRGRAVAAPVRPPGDEKAGQRPLEWERRPADRGTAQGQASFCTLDPAPAG